MDTRKQPSRLLATVLSLCMLFTMLPVGSMTAQAAGDVEVISENTAWDVRTISNDVQIASGVTVTVNGAITIDGTVTITGGGTIVRGSGNAYFDINSGNSLTLDGVTVDGDSISSSNSMFDVSDGTLNIKDSTVQNCVKSDTRGGAVNMEDGTLTIENTTITNCSATGYGGAIYLRDGADATIKSGTFSGNRTTDSSYGGGFIYNRSTLTIEGGTFQNNSSAGRGGAIYNAGTSGTAAYIRGGIFEGNTSSYSGYEGSGAVYYSSENTADTIIYISGSVRFGDGTASDGTDGVYLDTSGNALRKMQISSALRYPVHIYVACSEGRAIAQGVEDYQLTAADMTQLQFHDIGSSGTSWYAWLDSENNEVDVSATEPIYVVYDSNGATGSVTDNTIYSADNNTVTVKSNDGLTYEGHTFTGWNTKADGTGTTYQPGNTFNITETTTLYAQWETVASEAYDVWVGGVQVTEQNASDVLGNADGDGATVTYDAENKTLTLNGANITAVSSVSGWGNAAIVSYDELKIVLAEGSENNITLNGDKFFTGMIAMSENGSTPKNITVSGKGSLDIDITTSNAAAFGIMGSAVTTDSGADVSVTVNGTSTGQMVAYIGIMGYLSVAIEEGSVVTATVSNEAGENIAIRSTGAVTIENADVTASGYAGIMSSAGDISINGESTVKATGTGYAIATGQDSDITWDDTLTAEGRENAETGELLAVEIGVATADGTDNAYNTFVLSSDAETIAKYVEIVPNLHRHNICGEADCTHDGHTAVNYTALEGDVNGRTLTGGNYYLTDDITDVNTTSIQITGTVNLCLNGHTISGSAENGIIRVGEGGMLNICDCAGNGKVTETGAAGHNPIFLHSGGVLNLYGGTIESRITAVVIDEDPSSGGNNSTGGTVNVYGGTVLSTGNSYQAIKVNADMTNAAVNIFGGEVASSNRGISAESGELNISGGKISGNVVTADNVTMTAGTINGQLTIDSSPSEKKSVRISGDAKIETTSGNAIYSQANIDLEISGGTIIAQNGYAVSVTRSLSRIYLSGSPIISGSSADLRILPTSSADNAVLVLHAKNDETSVYEGGALSIGSHGTYNEDYYVAQGVTSAETANNFSLVGLSGYYLAYDETNKAIQIKESTYTVTLPSGQNGYTVTAANGSTSPVENGGSYSFTVTISDKYYKTDSFAVKANDSTLTPDTNGVYTIENITEAQTVTVEGVALDETAPTAQIQVGENRWNTFLNSITFGLFFKNIQTVTISATDHDSGVEKTEYFVSETIYQSTEALEEAADGRWVSYEKAFNITPKSKNIIYAKVTDNVGNVGYVSSDGIVLYTDATQDTQSISFTKTSTADVNASVNLNGNTISGIYCGEEALTYGEYYTVNSNTITFKASWLDTLSAGDHTLTIHYNPMGEEFVNGGGNVAPATTTISLSVQKATGSVEITNDISKVYDGQPVSAVTYQASSTGKVTVEYKVRGTYTPTKPSAVGEYTVRVTVAADDDYNEASATADFEITYLTTPSDPFQLSGTEGTGGWYTSNVTITPPEGYTISNTLNGEYSNALTVSASAENVTIYLKNEQRQMTNAVLVGEIKIDKDDPTITATGNTTDYLTDDTAKITALDSTSGVAKVEVKKDNGEFADITLSYDKGYFITENGTYTFRVTDNAGRTKEKVLEYNRIDRQTPEAAITATAGGESYTDGAWTNEDITLSVSNGNEENLGTTTYQYRVDKGEWQDYTAPIFISTDTDADGILYEFKAKSASGVESESVFITVKRDTIAPDGDITIKESSIRQFFNSITFGLFFNEDVNVVITGTDGLSGVASVQYYRSEEILREEQVEALTGGDWTEYNGTISVTAVDAEKFVYYVKVTDNAGNTICFASDGATFDLIPPSVTGVASGSTYYTTQKVTVTDTNLDVVMLNNERITLENGALTLSGNTEATYTITATDKAGNTTTVTVTMKSIASLAEDIQGLTTSNVVSADEETVNAVKTDTNAVDTENATEEEKTALQEILDNCEDLLEKIDEVEQEISGVTDSIGSFDPDSVKSSDKEAIEEFIEHIEELLGGGNLTETEKENLETVKGTAEDLLEKIDEIEQEISGVTDSIGSFDPDSVKSSDKEAIEEFIEHIEELLGGENLTESEKEALTSVKDEAETLLDKISESTGAGDTENVQKVEDVTPDNVKPEDKEDLEAAKGDIEQALSDYADNYTEDEKRQLEETLEQIEDALEVIQRVEDVEDAIGELPESVRPDDTEAAEQIEAAKEQYDALSEYEKSLVPTEVADKLNTLLALLGDYRIVEGNGSTWTKGSSEGLTFIVNGAYSKFTGIKIDGNAVSSENYTSESGSTVLTLKPDYLNTLTAGQHTITVLYTDGEAQGTFTVAEKPTEPTDSTDPTDEDSASPETGDNSHIVPWIILMLISGGAVLTTLSIKRRRRKA